MSRDLKGGSRGNSKYKGPEVGICLKFWRHGEETSVAEAEKVRGNEGREVMGITSCLGESDLQGF